MFKKIINSWNKLLARLAKENEEQFGNNRLCCCDLSKPPKGEKIRENAMNVEFFSAECKICERTLNILEFNFPDLKIEVHRASE